MELTKHPNFRKKYVEPGVPFLLFNPLLNPLGSLTVKWSKSLNDISKLVTPYDSAKVRIS